MKKVWQDVLESRTLKASSIERLIPGYDYSSPDLAHKTDEIFCALLVENLRTAKSVMFNVIETAYSLHREVLIRDFEALRDEIDLFSDEVKTRPFKWDEDKDQKWMGLLVDYDYRLLTGLGNLLKEIRALEKAFLSSKGTVKENQGLDKKAVSLKKDLDVFVIKFRERDVVCNISNEVLEETFEEKRAEIERGFHA